MYDSKVVLECYQEWFENMGAMIAKADDWKKSRLP